MPNLLRFAQRSVASAVLIAALTLPATGASAQSIAPIGIPQVGPPAQQLIVNGGFEDLAATRHAADHGWDRISMEIAAAVPLPGLPIVRVLGLAGGGTQTWDQRAFPYCGNNVLAAGNTWDGPGGGWAYQQVFIPANAPKPTLNFHLAVDSTVPTGEWNGAWYVPILYANPDNLKVFVEPGTPHASLNPTFATSWATLKPLATYTLYAANPQLDNSIHPSPTGWFGNSGWQRKGDFDLSAFRGQSVQIIFQRMNTSPPLETTNFYIDNVELWTATPSPIQLLNQPC